MATHMDFWPNEMTPGTSQPPTPTCAVANWSTWTWSQQHTAVQASNLAF